MATATKSDFKQTGLAHQLSELARRGGRLVSFTQPLPTLDPLTFFNNARRLTGTASYWARPADGFVLVGAGAAITLRGEGSERFKQIAEAWRNLTHQYIAGSDTLQSWGVGPLLMGGFAFDPTQQPKNPHWQSFGDGSMTLPQFLLTQTASQTFLTYNLVLPTSFDSVHEATRAILFEQYAENIALLRTALTKPASTPLASQPKAAQPNFQDVLPASEWQAMVGRATQNIKAGNFQKAVLAREVVATFERPIEVETTLRQLEQNFPTATIFAIAEREKCFLGATPERLVELCNGQVRTVALAGSAPRSQQPAEDERIGQELLDSPKNRGEHAVVVETIASQLENLCGPLDIPSAPRLLKLANVQHLYTPIAGQLRSEAGLLELVAKLHPTPAMGGYPRQEALDFIRQNEKLDRGWYAAPVGWLNARGEGDFAVAIRSALVEDKQSRLFAGCGIVADSDPANEYQESRIKLEAIGKAIGY